MKSLTGSDYKEMYISFVLKGLWKFWTQIRLVYIESMQNRYINVCVKIPTETKGWGMGGSGGASQYEDTVTV